MSGVEAIAIIGVVAAIVSAFENGDRLVKRLKDKRAAKKKIPPPAILEQSLVRGPREVKEEYRSGIQTYGESFESRLKNDRRT